MKQHFVSRVLLRRFSNAPSQRISRLTLPDLVSDEPPIDDVGQLEDFVVVGADKTEQRWQQVERALPHVFRLVDERRILESQAEYLDVVRDCIALHFARSLALAYFYQRDFPQYQKQVADGVLAQFDAAATVRAMTGLHVPAAAAQHLAPELLASAFDDHATKSGLAGEVLLKNYEDGRDRARGMGLQFWYSTGDEFLIGDVPTVSIDSEADEVGVLNGVTWDRANGLFMPLGPRHAVALSQTSEYCDADARAVEALNVFQVRGAFREVYCRPGSGLPEVLVHALGSGSPSATGAHGGN